MILTVTYAYLILTYCAGIGVWGGLLKVSENNTDPTNILAFLILLVFSPITLPLILYITFRRNGS